MKLVLTVDAISPPLTGIGRYAWELARWLQSASAEFESLRFLAGNVLMRSVEGLLSAPVRERSMFVAKWWARRQITSVLRDHLCHSPNYFLPRGVEGGIATVHDLSVFKFPETHPIERIRHFERNFSSTLDRAVHLITDSEAVRQEVITFFGWSPERVTAVELGVSDRFFPRAAEELFAVRSLGLDIGRYALCVSTLEPRKRVEGLLIAYATLPSSLRARYPLVLAGSKGWLNDTLLSEIEKGESQGWLRYLGYVDEAILPQLYAGARAFLYPSVYEGFGLPVREALASGIPTLTSNCSSLPEAAGGAARLVEPDNLDELRVNIESVLCDETWRANAIAAGLDVARRRTWSNCAEETISVYRRTLAAQSL